MKEDKDLLDHARGARVARDRTPTLMQPQRTWRSFFQGVPSRTSPGRPQPVPSAFRRNMARNPLPGLAGPSSRPPLEHRSKVSAPPPTAPRPRRSGPSPPSTWVSVTMSVLPLSEREIRDGSVLRVVDEACLGFFPATQAERFHFEDQRACGGLMRPNKNQTFMFDIVFDESKDEHTTEERLKTLLDGCNCSALAYGAGTEECSGVASLTVSELHHRVDELRSRGQKCHVSVTYFELYSEVVRDLLCPGASPLIARDDPSEDIAITNVSTHGVKAADSLLELRLRDNRNRSQYAPEADAKSSRSHAIYHVYISQTEKVTGTSKNVRASKMSSVDLAGSELVAGISRNNGARLRESSKINLLLLGLGNCVDALSKNMTQRVQYRNSKLTHILKASLGGTFMTATISPFKLSFSETHKTLTHAERAMKKTLLLAKNILRVNLHISVRNCLINAVKQKHGCLKQKLKASPRERKTIQRKLEGCRVYNYELDANVREVEESPRVVTARYEVLAQACTAGSASRTRREVAGVDGTLSVMRAPFCQDVEKNSPVSTTLAQAAEYYGIGAGEIYKTHAQVTRQGWDNEAIVHSALIEKNWRQRMAKTVGILQGTSEDAIKHSEPLDNSLQAEADARLTAKDRFVTLDSEWRANFECCQELLNGASAAGRLQLVKAKLAAQLAVAGTLGSNAPSR
ncbi:kinesin-like protein KIF18B [Haemaphysalis longicornis]|uniref:Kinesin motor domain-containing protein n=1 Tax=Haemaphysalis longicornis TaxID=44386 RepID=A0A9J6FI72_HAELO|nr:hypothetical protein HPB48_001260 [Haemaphysalis longicornis]